MELSAGTVAGRLQDDLGSRQIWYRLHHASEMACCVRPMRDLRTKKQLQCLRPANRLRSCSTDAVTAIEPIKRQFLRIRHTGVWLYQLWAVLVKTHRHLKQ